MATLRTDYVDDILAAAMDGKRQYQMIQNSNGTVSFVDVTDYTQNGDTFTSDDVNGINTQVNTNTAHINANSSCVPRNITSDLSRLTTAIAEQNLEKYGYKIGDYFLGTGSTPYVYWLADMNSYYGGINSYNQVDTPHIGVVVNTKLSSKWMTSDYTSVPTVYETSTLHTLLKGTVLEQIKTDIESRIGTWSNHLIANDRLYASVSISGTFSSSWASNTGEQTEYISALSEQQVFGQRISSSPNSMGEMTRRLQLFDKYFFNKIFNLPTTGSSSASDPNMVWLRDIPEYQSGAVYMNASGVLFYGYYSSGYSRTTYGLVVGLILLK